LPKNNVLRNTHGDGDSRQDGNSPSGISCASGSAIGGAFLVFLDAALMAVALKLADAPRNPVWVMGSAWGTGLIISAMTYQGTILTLTGHWLP